MKTPRRILLATIAFCMAVAWSLTAQADEKATQAADTLAPAHKQAAEAADTPTRAIPSMTAYRINPHAPKIDGRLDDPVWENATWVSGFRQSSPNEGELAQHASQVAIIYDDDAIYIGARLTSVDPNNIISTVSRRNMVSPALLMRSCGWRWPESRDLFA